MGAKCNGRQPHSSARRYGALAMPSHNPNDLSVYWTHGFIATLVVMVAIAGFCVLIPDSWLNERPAARRRRRVAAAEAVVGMDDVRLEREALRVTSDDSL